MISSYPEALRFLYENLPMFQRLGAAAIRQDLTNTRKLCEMLGDPQNSFRSIHVAGTNGKGSTCHMLASIMQASGYRTGLYTSPHLKEFTERVKVDGRELSQRYVVDFVNRITPAIQELHPSFFEITVAMAFDYFAQEGVDIAVIETGLGGRLDSTNVITPLVSVITNISWDHKDLLGGTLQAIAAEKAGIIKQGIPVVISERQNEVAHVFTAKAHQLDAEIIFASDEYTVEEDGAGISVPGKFRVADFPLKGLYQRRNIPGVIKAVDLLRRHFPITDSDIGRGLGEVVVRTGLKGRWQIIQNCPTVVCDTAHNEGGIREVLAQIARERFDRLFIILGMVKDKDVKSVLLLMPTEATYYFCQAAIPRAMEAGTLQSEAAALGLRGTVVHNVNDALNLALSQATPNDFIFIGGSTYVVAELDHL